LGDNINKYSTYKNIYNSTVRKSKISFYEENLAKLKNNHRKTWQLLNEIFGRSTTSHDIFELNVNNTKVTSPAQISYEFNTFFARAGQQISDTVIQTSTD
jgi:hypothetical protein